MQTDNTPARLTSPTPGKLIGCLLKAAIAAAALIALIAVAAWRTTAPEQGSAAFPSPDARTLLVVNGPLSPQTTGTSPRRFPFSLINRMRNRGAPAWKIITPDNPPRSITPPATALPLLDSSSPVPVGQNIILQLTANEIALASPSGGILARKSFPGQTIRSFSLSLDGHAIALSARDNVRSPYKSPFRLYTFPATFAEAPLEIDITGIYPLLIAGSLQWGPAGNLYFSGFDRDDHKRKATYMTLPGSTMPIPVPGNWGTSFSLSPDGSLAATVISLGLKLTDTTTGESRLIPTPGASPSLTLPAWSPDGKLVAFILSPSTQSKSNDHTLVIADPASDKITLKSKPIPGFFCGACPIAWSPSGKTILANGFTTTNSRSALPTDKPQIRSIDTSTGETSTADDPAPLWK